MAGNAGGQAKTARERKRLAVSTSAEHANYQAYQLPRRRRPGPDQLLFFIFYLLVVVDRDVGPLGPRGCLGHCDGEQACGVVGGDVARVSVHGQTEAAA